MTDIKFMDLSAPRRSTYAAGQIPSLQPRNAAEIPLAEYAVAMAIDVPQLVLYSRVSRDLEDWVERSRADVMQHEEDAATHQLGLIRKNTRLQAKSEWYDWKLQWIERLKHTAQTAFHDLQKDAKTLAKLKTETDEIVPELQREYDEISRLLEAEQQEVAEIEKCDQEYLNELKTSIAEQNVEVESLRAEVKEADDRLQWLQERVENIGQQKREHTVAIAEANRLLQVQTNSTCAEVFRLKNELQTLEDLHMFHISKVQSDLFEYIYASEYHVIIPCRDYLPLTERIQILRLAEIVQRLADFWSSTTQIRAQLRQLSIKYPVEIEPRRQFSEFAARTMVLFPRKKAKVYISFIFNSETFACWPLSIGSLRWEVEVGYGPIDKQAVLKAVDQRMGQVTSSSNYACLIDACIEAQETCG
ncbi:Spc7 kinetochore protein-domain-containing protein [Rhodocollybia butyracea]|uniref:Spc7 kinetochore protein-domain-containing protein n=1 Tax=Rhodocollybia butyracea TaxID=206335 RepID=A0A9P5Q0U1_9AGAR|nr:Spc7 kinetochore protein-domain-containing protein [Rhodocollybia butyracea]